jgi:uncharacterized membrane protein
MSNDRFGAAAEKFARFFGTSKFLIGQTVVVVIWITVNLILGADPKHGGHNHWDPSPFIMLNLLFSTQASYAAPLILLAESRKQQRQEEEDEKHERLLARIAEISEKLEDRLGL